jgi:CO/xanthine dehydrogenase FAD-binding subunit
MPLWKHYHIARSVDDALQALVDAPGAARLVAGGTDLLLDLQQGRTPPVNTLVDLTAVAEMTAIEMRQGRLFIGASVPLNRITQSGLVQQSAAALVQACSLIGSPQVRNVATLGGNVAHALPAADGAIALLALGATVEVATCGGARRESALIDLYKGPGQTALDLCQEILVGFYLPVAQPGQSSAFVRVMRSQGVALPILNMAAWLEREGEHIKDIRIAIGPAGPIPQRGTAAEQALRGQPPTAEVCARAVEALLGQVKLRTSPYRASADYRRHLTGVLLGEVLAKAWGKLL